MRRKELLLLLAVVAWVAACGVVLVQLGRAYNLERHVREAAAEARQAKALAEETRRTLQELQAKVAVLQTLTPTTAMEEEPLAPFPVFNDDSASEHLREEIDRITRELTWDGRKEQR